MTLELPLRNRRIEVVDQASMDVLRNGHFGELKDGRLILLLEEALYLIDIRNAECESNNKKISFNDLASLFGSKKKLNNQKCGFQIHRTACKSSQEVPLFKSKSAKLQAERRLL
jgi:tRNA splicing endonuclease